PRGRAPPPPRPRRRAAGEISRRRDERMPPALPPLEPYRFGTCHVNERSVDRAVTDLEVVSPLLFGQILSRVEREAVGVVGVIEESAYVVDIHSFSLETPWVRIASGVQSWGKTHRSGIRTPRGRLAGVE